MLNPRILVLDDALSAVDTYTEEEILARLRGVMRQRTSIIVSHRVSTVRARRRIFVLEDGRIVERGTPRRAGRARRRLRRAPSQAAARGGAARLSLTAVPCFHDEEVLGKAYDAVPDAPAAAVSAAVPAPRRRLRWRRSSATSVLQLAQPYLMKVAIDSYIATGNLAGLDRIALLFLAILLGSFALEYLQTWMLQMTGQRIMFDMRMQIYEHLQRLDVGFYDRNPVGRLMTRVTTDVDVLNDLFTAGVVSIFGDVFMLAGITIVLFVMDWRLALVALAVLPLIALVTQWFRRNARESYRTVRTLIARINAFLQEHITGMSTVQLFRQEARTFDALRRRQHEAPRRQRPVDLLLRRVLPGDRGHRRARGGADHLVRRRLDDAGDADAGIAGGVPAVLAAVLPADQRHVGEVQRPAGGDGLVRAHLQAAGHAGPDRVAVGASGSDRSDRVGAVRRGSDRSTGSDPCLTRVRARVPEDPGSIVFDDVSFAYNGDGLRAARTCRSRSGRASGSASSARRGRGSRR